MSFGYQVLGFGSGGVSAPYLVATGGTEVTCGDYKTHIFTGDGTFCVSAIGSCAGNNAVEPVVVVHLEIEQVEEEQVVLELQILYHYQ